MGSCMAYDAASAWTGSNYQTVGPGDESTICSARLAGTMWCACLVMFVHGPGQPPTGS